MTMKPVLHSFAYGFDFLSEQVADVASADMVAQPNGVMNHPAWVIGHLTQICQSLGGVIGVPPWLPDDWAKRFETGSVPVADANMYETKDDALAILRDAQSRITHAVEQLNESRLDEPFPDESFRDVFPSIRHFLTQVGEPFIARLDTDAFGRVVRYEGLWVAELAVPDGGWTEKEPAT